MKDVQGRGSPRGLLFNIQRYSTEDGPGIRTTLFLKGCPLKCLWCHNPESIEKRPQMLWTESKCGLCGGCVRVCAQHASRIIDGEMLIDRGACVSCGRCRAACANGAREIAGVWMSSEEAFREAEKDTVFFEKSGGGLTISGGEPTLQAEFTHDVFRKCRARAIHTALDTCGYARWEVMEPILVCTDLVLFDLKVFDPDSSLSLVGVNPSLIFKNLENMAARGTPTWIRIPIVPGFTDTDSNIAGLMSLVRSMKNIARIDLLAYHELGRAKGERLGLDERSVEFERPSAEEMEEIARRVRALADREVEITY